MRLTTRGRYAVTAMADLAVRGADGPTPLSEISSSQSISATYLEQLFGRLRRAGLVESMRGVGGGYKLARPASEIAISDIVLAADESIDTTACGATGTDSCRGDGTRCLTHDLWDALGREIRGFLDGVSLADVADGRLKPVPLEAAE
ncbi:MAG: Rrf2 family transcriptional regulator [Pseudomonadota bacterium]